MRPELEHKVKSAIKLLRTMSEAYENQPIEVAYSGGKDSDVILQLTREAGIPYRAIYKNTTIDPPGTIKHVLEMGVEVARPKDTFFKLIQKKGAPSRHYRFCCQVLKEYHYDKSIHKTIIGVRRSESTKRAARYIEPTGCIGTKKCPNEAIYPLLYWSNKDVQEFIEDRNIKCHPIYYDENGNFHVERRLGCMCCPLIYRKKRVEEFKKYPKMLKAYTRNLKIYMHEHPNANSCKYFCNEYEWMYRDLFCDSMSQFTERKDGLFGKPDYKKALEDFFGIKL